MRLKALILATTASLALIGAANAGDGRAINFDIPAQRLDESLRALGMAADRQVLFSADVVAGRQGRAVSGDYTTDEALAKLLAGTGLVYEERPSGVLMVKSPEARRQGTRIRHTDTSAASQASRPLQTAAAQGAPAPVARADAQPSRIEEVIVTAQKREERLQDVPVPVTAVNAEDLAQSNQFSLKDYFVRIPGLNFTVGNRSEPLIAIRGITTGLATPTVGITVDDVPYGATSSRGGGFLAPDFDPSDLARIEVLRGPQGTLYGVSSLGGLIKYVTVDPSMDGVFGNISTGISSVHGGHEMGYNVRGALNVPVTDELAVRISGYSRTKPGYIDDPNLNIRDVNSGDAMGGRLAALWRPGDNFSLKLGAIYQERNNDGSDLVFVGPTLGDLQQDYKVRDSGWFRTRYQAYSATMNGQIGDIALTSLTGYNINQFRDSVDLSVFFGATANQFFGSPFYLTVERYRTKKFSQELRAVAPLGDRLELLLGAFYTKEKGGFTGRDVAVIPTTGRVLGVVQSIDSPATYEEYAGFADLTAQITDTFDVQIGARQSHNRQTLANNATGPVNGAGVFTPVLSTPDDAFTYLLTPRLKFSPDMMVYARFASGYRAGGVNLNAFRFPAQVPPGYGADKTKTYEVGAKGNVIDGALSFDASLFRVDWTGVQLNVLPPSGIGFQTNGPKARSQGVELSAEAHPTDGLTIAGSLSWSDPELREDFGPLSPLAGPAGAQLPFATKFAGTLSVDQEFALSGDWMAFVGGTLSHVGSRMGYFRPNVIPQRQAYPSYTQIDARAGLEYDTWRINLSVQNLTDKRGQLGGGLGNIASNSFIYTQPRTVALSVAKDF